MAMDRSTATMKPIHRVSRFRLGDRLGCTGQGSSSSGTDPATSVSVPRLVVPQLTARKRDSHNGPPPIAAQRGGRRPNRCRLKGLPRNARRDNRRRARPDDRLDGNVTAASATSGVSIGTLLDRALSHNEGQPTVINP